MSELIKHECGFSLIRLKKDLSFYKEKYGTYLYGIDKMFLMMQKQHNRGQDGTGFASIKMDMSPGNRYISRLRSKDKNSIQHVFSKIMDRIHKSVDGDIENIKDINTLKESLPYIGELMLGHVRYGTFGKNNLESVHPFLRQNNWMHRNLILAGNFTMTNTQELFENLVQLGQHPKDRVDTITIMERIGHFLDDEVDNIYRELKKEGINKRDASPLIIDKLNIPKILKESAKKWDGGYVIAGMIGHGDAFVLRDSRGIRPAYYYENDEVVVVASERPAIQTVFEASFNKVKPVPPGSALIVKKNGQLSISNILEPAKTQSCSFERIYFSRGTDSEIYNERKKLGELLLPEVLSAINEDVKNTVFSFIPNTAETAFFGMVNHLQLYINQNIKAHLQNESIDKTTIEKLLDTSIRIEKIAVKDLKLRTFISEDSGRDSLVEHSYDITYGVVKPTDNLVIIDDSIVRGTTLKKSILKMLAKLNPKKIIILSSAPQIKYPDCYGIDMAKIENFIAFQGAIALHKEKGTYKETIDKIYKQCVLSLNEDIITENCVKQLYSPFTDKEISKKIGELLSKEVSHIPVEIIYQSVENLRLACPKNTGDWYFTGDYPTHGGNRVVHKSFINFYEGKNNIRAY